MLIRIFSICLSLILILCLAGIGFSDDAAKESKAEDSDILQPSESEIQQAIKEQVIEEVELTDPISGEKVTGYDVKAFYSAGVDKDFCQRYAGQNLYDKWVTCGKSGYCGYIEDFKITSLPPDVKENIKKEILPNYKMSEIGPWDRYEITAKIYKWRGKKDYEIGTTYLRGTYTLRGLPMGPLMREKEKHLRTQAIKYLRLAEKKGQIPYAEISNAKYLIGELYRRNEKFSRAIRYYEDALKIKNRPDWVDKWATEQISKAYAEYAD